MIVEHLAQIPIPFTMLKNVMDLKEGTTEGTIQATGVLA